MFRITEADIAQGLRNREFFLHYRPKASLMINRIVGAEALGRWRRSDGSLTPPAAFIPVAERSSLIKELSMQLLSTLVQDLTGKFPDDGLHISFNVSSRDLKDALLTRAILDAVTQHALPRGALEIEITETQALQGGAGMHANVQLLAEAGVGLAMDDYGIGYSSMDTLSQWPFTTIKLDQGIIGRMLNCAKNATIVRSSIRLGHELGLTVVAEGVETTEQYDFLVEAGCRVAQGYLVSRPLPLDQFDAFRRDTGTRRGVPVGLVHMAIVDHVQWRHQMVSYATRRGVLPAASPQRRLDGYPPLAVTKCALGAWYAGEGRYFANTSAYQAIDAPHHALHEVGTRIVDRVRAGTALADMKPLLDECKQASVALIRLLEDLEDEGLAALYAMPPTCSDPVALTPL